MAVEGLMRQLLTIASEESSCEPELTVLRALTLTPLFRDFASLGGPVVLVMSSL